MWGLGASAAAVALVMFGFAAQAQKAPEPKAAPAAPAAKAAPAPAAKAEKKAKPKSACNALTEEAACKADTGCSWIAASMDKATGKQKRKAYCRTKAKPVAKKKAAEPAKK